MNFFLVLPVPLSPGVCSVLDRIFWVCLGVLKKYYVTQDGICLLKSWKEKGDGSHKVFFHVPSFGVRQ